MIAPRRDAAGGPAAGFSLVEMLVVLVLLGLAAALGGPSLLSLLPGRQLDAAAASLADELALLRAEAVRTGRRTSLAYDAGNARFLSSRRAGRPLAMAPLSVGVAVPADSWAGPGEIRFLPGGASTGGRIVLAGRAGQRVLTVSRVTGAVRRGEVVP